MSTTSSPSITRTPVTHPVRFALLAIGPLAFVAMFAIRAFLPVFDPILLSITVAAAVVSVFMLAGQRWAAGAYFVFPIAALTSPATADFSFNLTAIDSGAWLVHTVVALVGMGWGMGSAAVVLARRTSPGAVLGGLAGGLVAGMLLIGAVQVIAPQPGFGSDLTDDELAALPVIEMVNYAYRPAAIDVDATSAYIARLDNPSDLPHTYTIDALDLEVYVPARRWAVVEITPEQLARGDLAVICTIGDHLERGMQGLVRPGR